MAGRRLLDAALVLHATRTVARQHFRIRGEQIDLWAKTSSLAKAIKNQTDRVTVTAAAAQALASRLNENAPQQYHYDSGTKEDLIVPRRETVKEAEAGTTPREGLQQDHHYKPAAENAVHEKLPAHDADVEQRAGSGITQPDGTILPPSASVAGSRGPEEQLESEAERGQAPAAEPLAGEQSRRSLRPEASEQSTLDGRRSSPADTIPQHEARPAQESIPEDVNTDVFHSPKIAELLGGAKKRNPYDSLRPKHAVKTPVDQNAAERETDQETFNVRKPHPLAPEQDDSKTKFEAVANHSDADLKDLAADIAKDAATAQSESFHGSKMPQVLMYLKRLRMKCYAGLGTSMAFGAVNESFRRVVGAGSGGSLLLSPANMERLVAKLSRMRGAALKLGQMMSLQDSRMLPAPIADVLQRVQDNADYMPPSQRNQVLEANLGPEWRSLFSSFDDKPIAAASIGQVHKAVLSSDGSAVAVKVQYPGVAQSISSDLNNLSLLLTASRLLPKGLFLDKTIANARTELSWECDYEREARYQDEFYQLLRGETDIFTVPKVIKEACGPQVLTAEYMSGKGVTKSSLHLSQDQRNSIGTNILRLCLRELTEFKLMQTDPNWTNFLYNPSTNKLELLDFGAAREFPDRFIDPYVRCLIAAANGDRDAVRDYSMQLGYLTGAESQAMIKAHVDSVMTLSEPFSAGNALDSVYDFENQTVTDRVRALIPVMIRERLSPPPEETYSLHRKLSGAFLLLAKLGSRVKCREMFVDATTRWDEKHTS